MKTAKSLANRGQQHMFTLGISYAAIGSRVNASKQAVAKWLSGRTKPATEVRKRLREAFGCEPAWWDQAPLPPPPNPAAPPAPPQPPAGYGPADAQIADEPEPFEPPDFAHPGTATAELRASCARLRKAIDRATNPAPSGAPPADAATIAKLEKQYQTALFMLGKAQGEITPAEQRTLCKSPTFYRIVGELRDALTEALETALPGDQGKPTRSAILDRFAATFYAKWGPAEDTDDR